jgi:hypothetical protein
MQISNQLSVLLHAIPPERAQFIVEFMENREVRLGIECLLENLYDAPRLFTCAELDCLREFASKQPDAGPLFEMIGLLRLPHPRPTIPPL